jgi:tight adherence protein B
MASVFEYILYAAAFIAVVLGVEGLARLVQANIGEERKVAQRLAKSRAQPTVAQAAAAPAPRDRFSKAIATRFPGLEEALTAADAPFSLLQLLLLAITLFVVVFVLLRLVHAPLLIGVVAGAALAIGAPVATVSGLISRRRRRFLDQMPQAVDLIARSLQAGHPVTSAMTVVGQRMSAPLGPEFRTVVEEMAYGLDRSEAIANMLRRFPLAELRMFAACLEVTRESGGNLAEVFLKLAEAIRAKDNLRQKVFAISAEGRMSFWVVSGLPFVVGGALMLLRPQFFLDVAQDKLFWPMMSYAPVSLAIGAAMIWRMVNLKI